MHKLTCMINGPSKAGKTWLGISGPGPRLVLDVEGRTEYAPTTKVTWDGRGSAPDVSPDTTVLVPTRTFETMGLVFPTLQSGNHPFRSFIIDSGPELQQRLINDVTHGELRAPSQDEWGVILRKMEAMTRAMRDMVRAPGQPLEVFAMLCGVPFDGMKRPLFQGAYQDKAPYLFDLEGYLYAAPVAGGFQRRLRIQPIAGLIEAGDGTNLLTVKYGEEIINPNLTEILAVLNEESK